MLVLGAVDPKGVGVVDSDGVDSAHAHCFARGRRYKACVETGGVGELGDGLARLVKRRLSGGVVSSKELKLDHVAYCRGEVIGLVCKSAVEADFDNVDVCLGYGCLVLVIFPLLTCI